MRVIKHINNNAAVCIDDNGCELIAFGKGIGFPKIPYEISDLDIVDRTYYNVDPMYYEAMNTIPEKILDVTADIVEIYKTHSAEPVSSNLVFTLADHINFAIDRCKKNITVPTPLQYDVQYLYELEYNVGVEALKIIQKELDVHLPKSEASNIALHFINAGTVSSNLNQHTYIDRVIDDITDIIAQYFRIYIDKSTFNYSRFVSHLHYLLKRSEKGTLIATDNEKMFESISNEYHDTYEAVLKIKNYLYEELGIELNQEEMLYLILHVNRLCVREDCNRKSVTPTQDE